MKIDFLAVFVIVVNSFSWYFPLYFFFKSVLDSQVLLMTLSIHYIAAIGSTFAGRALTKKLSSYNFFLSLWMLLGTFASSILIVLDTNNTPFLLLVSFILGVSMGLGFPSCLAYFGDCTSE